MNLKEKMIFFVFMAALMPMYPAIQGSSHTLFFFLPLYLLYLLIDFILKNAKFKFFTKLKFSLFFLGMLSLILKKLMQNS